MTPTETLVREAREAATPLFDAGWVKQAQILRRLADHIEAAPTMTTEPDAAEVVAELKLRIAHCEFVIENENRMFMDAAVEKARKELPFYTALIALVRQKVGG